jgi:hypothetical protein
MSDPGRQEQINRELASRASGGVEIIAPQSRVTRGDHPPVPAQHPRHPVSGHRRRRAVESSSPTGEAAQPRGLARPPYRRKARPRI